METSLDNWTVIGRADGKCAMCFLMLLLRACYLDVNTARSEVHGNFLEKFPFKWRIT